MDTVLMYDSDSSLITVPVGKPITTIAHNTSSSSIFISWKAPAPDTILGEFLGYRITYRVRDKHNDTTKEVYIRDSSVEVSFISQIFFYYYYYQCEFQFRNREI